LTGIPDIDPMDGPNPLLGRVVVVTGGAGGLGSAICRTCANAGASVVVGFRRDEAKAQSLTAQLHGSGHAAIRADVTDAGSLKLLAQEVGGRYGKVDLLVNCAGTTRFVPHSDLEALDDDLIDDIFRTNWRGPFATIRALRPLLSAGRGGLVVNVSSIAGTSGVGSNVAYCASKAALNTMTVSLARALAPAIRVVSVCPGLVDTEFIKGLDENWRREQIERTPLGRLASPEDVGQAVLAVSTNLLYSTGSVITVDGGRLLG
jgi:3-oxoacyl-[acyl-carrier protein] reductase